MCSSVGDPHALGSGSFLPDPNPEILLLVPDPIDPDRSYTALKNVYFRTFCGKP